MGNEENRSIELDTPDILLTAWAMVAKDGRNKEAQRTAKFKLVKHFGNKKLAENFITNTIIKRS